MKEGGGEMEREVEIATENEGSAKEDSRTHKSKHSIYMNHHPTKLLITDAV